MMYEQFFINLKISDILNLIMLPEFNPVFDLIFGTIYVLLDLIISIRANILYSKTRDPRFAVVGAFFACAAIFQLSNTSYSYIFNFVNHQYAYLTLQFLFIAWANIFCATGLFISIFFSNQLFKLSKQNLRVKVHLIIGLIALTIIGAAVFLFQYYPELFKLLANKLFISNPPFEILDNLLFILSTIILLSIRKYYNTRLISPLVAGLLAYGVLQIYLVTPSQLFTFFRYYLLITKTLALYLILLGINELNFRTEFFSFRIKQTVYPSLFLFFTYFLNYTINSFVLNISYPNYIHLMLLVFILGIIIFQYKLSDILVEPLSFLIKKIQVLNPAQKPEPIPVISNDEIGILTQEINNATERDWKSREREGLTRKIIETIRTSLDIDEVLKTICDETAKVFNIQRAAIIKYPNRNNYQEYTIKIEYKTRPEIKGVINSDIKTTFGEFWGEESLEKGRAYAIDNIEISDMSEEFKNFYRNLGIKSIIGAPIQQNGNKWGVIILSEYDYYRHWTEDEINLLQTISNQIYLAINQAELFSTTKKQANKEALLREIINAIRSTLDINEMNNKIVTEVGQALEANRCMIIEYDENAGKLMPIKYEFLSSKDLKSTIGIDQEERVKEMSQKVKLGQEFMIPDVEDFIKNNNLINSNSDKYFREYNVQSVIGMPITYANQFLGVLVIQYTSNKGELVADSFQLVKDLVSQIGIALFQSKLYTREKQTAEREKLLTNVISTIRSTLDIHQAKKLIVDEVGKTFKADRCYFRTFDKKLNKFLPPDIEYLRSPDIPSMKNAIINQESFKYFLDKARERRGFCPIILNQEAISREHLENTLLSKYFEQAGIKTDVAIPMWDRYDELSFLVLHYTNDIPYFPKEDIELMITIAKQTSIAIDQSTLYETVKQNAERERILREIISEIKSSQSIEEIFQKALPKIAEIYGVDRTLYIDLPKARYEKPIVKYEYIKLEKLLPLKNKILPDICTDTFTEVSKKLKPVHVDNAEQYHKDNTELQNFFITYRIGSILLIPLIKYEHNIQVLGLISICSQSPRSWTEEDANLISALADPVENTISEIQSRREIEELRNTFILTLAHDLQVPLIGERKVLEFLAPRPEINKYKNMIDETIESNKNIYDLLSRLILSYNYESGKQELHLEKDNINQLINESMDLLKPDADSKSIKIEIQIPDNLPDINVDKSEIIRVIRNLLGNAINYTQEGGHIVIKCSRQNNEIITCIADNGPGIAPDVRERIFERYAMASAIERKVGSGLGLYLSKQIIEAHKGKIWYSTELGRGTTFCFTLPIAA